MRKSILFLVVLFHLSLFTSQAISQEKTHVSGYMFGDYYYVLNNHNEDLEGENGFWFRRIYLTFDRKENDNVKVRLRLEANSKGDFKSTSTLDSYVKDAYLQYTKNNHSIIFGISPTPTFSVIEKVWGYRFVEKTPLDLQKYAPSRDFGIVFKGVLDTGKKLSYNIMFSNGSGYKSETGKGKKLMAAFLFNVKSGWLFEAYADIEDRNNGQQRTTLQGFAGFQSKKIRFGIQAANQTRRIGPNTDDLNMTIYSIFGAGKLSDKLWAFLRFDRNTKTNSDGEKISYIPFSAEANSSLIIGGLDIKTANNINIVLNVEFVMYKENINNITPDSDVIPRLTVFYKF